MTYIDDDRKAQMLDYLDERYGRRRGAKVAPGEIREDDRDRLIDDGVWPACDV